MALPTMAPSDSSAMFRACSGVEMPKPTARGMGVDSRTSRTMASMSVVISLRTPVTPREETIYKKPVASRAIMAMRFSEVGAAMEIRSTP